MDSDINSNDIKLAAENITSACLWGDLKVKKAEPSSAKKSIEVLEGDLVMKEEDISSSKPSIDGINTDVATKEEYISYANGKIESHKE